MFTTLGGVYHPNESGSVMTITSVWGPTPEQGRPLTTVMGEDGGAVPPAHPFDGPKAPPVAPPSKVVRQGWQCPVCLAVWAPHISACADCNRKLGGAAT